MGSIRITVFTPTYNRGYIIENLYASLKRQTVTDFEWLVVDDGSTDNTQELFDRWEQEENSFPIRYIKTQNGGKHRAVNRGVKLAEGELFFIVDSDDFLADDAIEMLLLWRDALPDDKTFAGIAGARGFSANEMIGTGHGAEYLDCKNTEREKYGLRSDKAEAYFTHIMRQFPFPEFDGENFITESVVWNAISQAGYKLRWYDRIIYIGEYRSDGLTADNMGLFLRNPRGHLHALKSDFILLENTPRRQLAICGMYYKVGKQIGMATKLMATELGVPVPKLLLCGLLRQGLDKLRSAKIRGD